jgi:7-cyano-7-deazaguanine synthase
MPSITPGYPDCRPAFVAAFERVANLATKAAVEGTLKFEIATPLIDLTKAQIIRRGLELGVDFSLTVSCYQADAQGRACGRCDACRLRRDGFKAAGVADPTRYANDSFSEQAGAFRYHARPARYASCFVGR